MSIKLPVRAEQSSFQLWRVIDAESVPVAETGAGEYLSREIAYALNVLPELQSVVKKLLMAQSKRDSLRRTATSGPIEAAESEVDNLESEAIALAEPTETKPT